MKAYPTYKESSIDWIGRIPSHWETKKGKYLFDILSGDAPAQMEITESGSYAYIKVDDLNTNDTTLYITEGKERFENVDNAYDEGVIVFPKRGAAIFTNKVKITKMQCLFDTNLMGLKVFPDVANKEFVAYCLLTRRLDDIADTSTVPQINNKHIYPLEFPFPKPNEQQAIADFLDRKTAQIDTLIEKKQRQIDLLQEQRTALINHAVTKGLNPKVKMKDSGVEWLGEIPSHWEVKRIKHLIQSKKNSIKTGPFGSQLTNADMAGTDVKVYNQRSVIDNDFVNGENYVSLEKFQQLKEFEIYAGDILITTRGTIGRCAIFPENAEKGILHPCLIRLQMNEELILKEYLIGFIQDSVLFKQSIFFESNATTIEVIYSGTMKQVPVPVPPVEEQQKIIKYLSELKNKVQLATEKLENEIMLLQEYRTALISEAVTGKIDVRTAETVHESPTGTM